MKNSEYHIPVLLHAATDALVLNPNGVYVDVTFGGGGHSRAILDKLDKGLDFMTPKEKRVIEAYTKNHILLLTTEYRLGRMDRNPIYFRNTMRNMLNNKASLEVIKSIRLNTKETSAREGFIKIIDEVYEELSGEKLPDLKN